MNLQRPPGYEVYQPPNARPVEHRMSTPRVIFNVVGAVVLVVLAAVAVVVVVRPRDGSSSPPVGVDKRSPAQVLVDRVRSPQVVVDEEMAIGAHGYQMRGVSLRAERSVRIVIEGRTHADKGFTVYVMSTEDFRHFEQNESFRHVSSFEGLKVRSLAKTNTLPRGDWAVVVSNSENIFNTMVAHVRIVLDPS